MLFWERREDIAISLLHEVGNTTPIFRSMPCFFQPLQENYDGFNAWTLLANRAAGMFMRARICFAGALAAARSRTANNRSVPWWFVAAKVLR
jgi:hypothetical protein